MRRFHFVSKPSLASPLCCPSRITPASLSCHFPPLSSCLSLAIVAYKGPHPRKQTPWALCDTNGTIQHVSMRACTFSGNNFNSFCFEFSTPLPFPHTYSPFLSLYLSLSFSPFSLLDANTHTSP